MLHLLKIWSFWASQQNKRISIGYFPVLAWSSEICLASFDSSIRFTRQTKSIWNLWRTRASKNVHGSDRKRWQSSTCYAFVPETYQFQAIVRLWEHSVFTCICFRVLVIYGFFTFYCKTLSAWTTTETINVYSRGINLNLKMLLFFFKVNLNFPNLATASATAVNLQYTVFRSQLQHAFECV